MNVGYRERLQLIGRVWNFYGKNLITGRIDDLFEKLILESVGSFRFLKRKVFLPRWTFPHFAIKRVEKQLLME